MSTPPVVSVVIPAFNAGRWIEETLASAQDQTLREIEIIVVDDGSTDDTAERVIAIACSDHRIRLVRIDNRGVGAARNIGIDIAQGCYIAPLDADDSWHRTKLEKLVSRFEALGEQVGLVYCWYESLDANGAHLYRGSPDVVDGEASRALLLRNFVGNASVPLFRKAALQDVGGYLTREEQAGAQGCEDWDLSLRVAERWRVGVVPEVLVGYRKHESSMSTWVEQMGCSYQVLMQRVRARNPALPNYLLRWSAGHFQRWLVLKGYESCSYRACLRAAWRAVRADPVVAVDPKLVTLTAKSVIWLITGGRKASRRRAARPVPVPGGTAEGTRSAHSTLERIQRRRWMRFPDTAALRVGPAGKA